jgi:hypothetical protein
LLSIGIWLGAVFNFSRVLSLLSLLKGTPDSRYESSDGSLSLATTAAVVPVRRPALSAVFFAGWDYHDKLLLARLLIAKLGTKLSLLSSLIATHVCLGFGECLYRRKFWFVISSNVKFALMIESVDV